MGIKIHLELLFIIAILNSCNIRKSVDCSLYQSYSTAVYSKNKGIFEQINIELGEPLINYQINYCKKSGNTINLKGEVKMDLVENKNNSGVNIFLGFRENKNDYIIKDTLAITDKLGKFNVEYSIEKKPIIIIYKPKMKAIIIKGYYSAESQYTKR